MKFEQTDMFDHNNDKPEELGKVLVSENNEKECQYCGGFGECKYCKRGKEEIAEGWKALNKQ